MYIVILYVHYVGIILLVAHYMAVHEKKQLGATNWRIDFQPWGKWIPTVVLWLVCFGNALAYICSMDIIVKNQVLRCQHVWLAGIDCKSICYLFWDYVATNFQVFFSKLPQVFERLASKMFPNQRYGGRPHLHVFARTLGSLDLRAYRHVFPFNVG